MFFAADCMQILAPLPGNDAFAAGAVRTCCSHLDASLRRMTAKKIRACKGGAARAKDGAINP